MPYREAPPEIGTFSVKIGASEFSLHRVIVTWTEQFRRYLPEVKIAEDERNISKDVPNSCGAENAPDIFKSDRGPN